MFPFFPHMSRKKKQWKKGNKLKFQHFPLTPTYLKLFFLGFSSFFMNLSPSWFILSYTVKLSLMTCEWFLSLKYLYLVFPDKMGAQIMVCWNLCRVEPFLLARKNNPCIGNGCNLVIQSQCYSIILIAFSVRESTNPSSMKYLNWQA